MTRQHKAKHRLSSQTENPNVRTRLYRKRTKKIKFKGTSVVVVTDRELIKKLMTKYMIPDLADIVEKYAKDYKCKYCKKYYVGHADSHGGGPCHRFLDREFIPGFISNITVTYGPNILLDISM